MHVVNNTAVKYMENMLINRQDQTKTILNTVTWQWLNGKLP